MKTVLIAEFQKTKNIFQIKFCFQWYVSSKKMAMFILKSKNFDCCLTGVWPVQLQSTIKTLEQGTKSVKG